MINSPSRPLIVDVRVRWNGVAPEPVLMTDAETGMFAALILVTISSSVSPVSNVTTRS